MPTVGEQAYYHHRYDRTHGWQPSSTHAPQHVRKNRAQTPPVQCWERDVARHRQHIVRLGRLLGSYLKRGTEAGVARSVRVLYLYRPPRLYWGDPSLSSESAARTAAAQVGHTPWVSCGQGASCHRMDLPRPNGRIVPQQSQCATELPRLLLMTASSPQRSGLRSRRRAIGAPRRRTVRSPRHTCGSGRPYAPE